MNGAEFKTMREYLGFYVDNLSEIFNVTPRSIKYWESSASPVKADVSMFLVDLDKRYTKMVDHAVSFLTEEKNKNSNIVVNLLRYRSDDDFNYFMPNFKPVTAKSHATMLNRLKLRLGALDISCNIVWMNKGDYLTWLRIRDDSESLRAEWASLQA